MKDASTLLQLVGGIALAMMLTGGVVLATDCDDDGTCETDVVGGVKLGCTKASSGENCDPEEVGDCTCASNSRGECVCD